MGLASGGDCTAPATPAIWLRLTRNSHRKNCDRSDEPADAASAESACLHVINSFDIPAGVITEEFKPGQVVDEVTSWVTVCNLTDRRYGYRTIGDPVPYVVDLTTTDFSTSRRTPVPDAARFTPVTV